MIPRIIIIEPPDSPNPILGIMWIIRVGPGTGSKMRVAETTKIIEYFTEVR